MITIELIRKQLKAKEKEIFDLKEALIQVEDELASLKEQRDRFLYDGMSRKEYISSLYENPIKEDIEGFLFRVEGYLITGTLVMDEKRHISFQTTVYKDDTSYSTYVESISEKGSKTVKSTLNDFPKKYAKHFKKMKDIAFKFKTVED